MGTGRRGLSGGTPLLAALAAALVVAALLAAPVAEAAGPCDPPVVSAVACENTRPGNPPSEWDVAGAGSSSIQGFATEISVNRGETVRFKVDTPASAYRLDIYRMGYYGGDGARRVATVRSSVGLPQNQPDCLYQSSTGLTDCGNWAVSASWPVPADAVSGVYFAKLVREDGTSGSSHVVFVVRDDSGGSDLLFQTADTTWQAYNTYGGNSTYTGSPAGRAYKVSYNRPFATRGCCDEDWVFNAEYPMVRWLESNGYDVSYTTGVDTDRRGGELLEHEAFVSVGHDEYWSGRQRANVEAARAAGVHLAFFSGNEVFWKTRWETAIDGSGTAHRTLVVYKETHADAKIDPSPEWTGTWRDPRFSPPSDGGRPENALTGTIFTVNCCTYEIEVPEPYGKLRLWRNTSVANLSPGQVATLGTDTLGYEWDEDLDNGHRPPGLVRLSSTTKQVSQRIQDHGSSYGSGTATHALTLYRHPSGALVFGAGTVQWTWGLDSEHDRGSGAADVRMRQATVNLLADMGAQPTTLQPGLVPATASTDATPPTTVITAPAAGASVEAGEAVTVTGNAGDVGGRVGAVEVSADGGTTWRPATGRESWSHTWTPATTGSATLLVRAVDDSANIQPTPTPVTVTVRTRTCPCSLWGDAVVPPVLEDPDTDATELGLRFRAMQDGYITGIRFYKSSGNTGTHVGSLWTNSGQRLAEVTFTNETPSGWQTAMLANPVPVQANTTYVVSYNAPNGRYSVDTEAFQDTDVFNAPLRAMRDGEDGANGLYRYGSTAFPTNGWRSTNFFVDVVFATDATDTTPPAVTAHTPAADSSGVSPGTNLTATFSEAVDPETVGLTARGPSGPVSGALTYDAGTRTATFDPAADLATSTIHTARVEAADLADNAMSAEWSFTTAAEPPPPGTCPCSLWNDTTTPSVPANDDDGEVEVGVRFRADQDGYVNAIRFYKGVGNSGPHPVTLWTRDGQELATATSTTEAGSGWQEVAFAQPVPITGGTTYVASYHAPQGRYALDVDAFAFGGVTHGPLTALGDGIDGANGLYGYGARAFPTNSWRSSNYWVDVVFVTGTAPPGPPVVVATTPATGASDVSVDATVTATFNVAIDPATLVAVLRAPDGTDVPSTLGYDADTRTVTLDPDAPLADDTTFTASLRATDLAGNDMSDAHTWSFSTEAAAPPPPPPDDCPCSLWSLSTTPAVLADSERRALELGVKFQSSQDGSIKAIRFYKSSLNTGTHVGSLWTSSGQRLATVTFTGETASGWQEATFATPVAVSAGTTYVASYHAPNGRYSIDRSYFGSARTNGPLSAPASGSAGGNGVYRYGASAFPTSSWQASNYWVDVVFE